MSAPEHKAPAFGKLSAEDYIKVRHTEVLARYERSVRRLRLGVGLVDALAILLTSGGTALVAVGLVRWVPVLMAFAAAVASIANHAALGPQAPRRERGHRDAAPAPPLVAGPHAHPETRERESRRGARAHAGAKAEPGAG